MRHRLMAAIVVMFAGVVVAAPHAFAATLRFCYEDKEISPLYLGDGSSVPAERPGLAVEMIQRAAIQAGLTPVAVRAPWKRCLADLKAGGVDALVASWTAERDGYGIYPGKETGQSGPPDAARRFATSAYHLYRRKNAPPVWDGARLGALAGAVGVPRGYSVAADLRRMGVEVVESSDSLSPMMQLMRGNLEAAATLAVAGDALLAADSRLRLAIERIDPPLASKDYYLVLSPSFVGRGPALAQTLWAAVVQVREGDMPAIAARYAQDKP